MEILIITSVFLALGAGIGLAVHFIQKPDVNKANAEEMAVDTCSEKADAEKEPVQAVILCSGTMDENPSVYHYRGVQDCRAAMALGTGGRICESGCIGFGSCARVCPEEAISVRKGIASVNMTSCTGCGVCVNVCPKNLIVLRPRNFRSGKQCILNCPGGICGACDSADKEMKN